MSADVQHPGEVFAARQERMLLLGVGTSAVQVVERRLAIYISPYPLYMVAMMPVARITYVSSAHTSIFTASRHRPASRSFNGFKQPLDVTRTINTMKPARVSVLCCHR